MLKLSLVSQEDLLFLLLAGIPVESSPGLLHESPQRLFELRINDYFLDFRDDGIEVGIFGSLIRAYMGKAVLKTS
jgi:hypothetical protein